MDIITFQIDSATNTSIKYTMLRQSPSIVNGFSGYYMFVNTPSFAIFVDKCRRTNWLFKCEFRNIRYSLSDSRKDQSQITKGNPIFYSIVPTNADAVSGDRKLEMHDGERQTGNTLV